MCCCWLDIFLGQSTHDVVSADRDFYKAIKKYLLIVDNFLLQCTTVTSTQDKSKSTSSFDHFKFSYDLFHPHSLDRCLSGTKQSSLTVKCLDIGHCLPPPPVGKWKISVACNKYFSVGCLCVYVSIAPKLSPRLLPVLLRFQFFVSLSRLHFSIIPHYNIMIKSDCTSRDKIETFCYRCSSLFLTEGLGLHRQKTSTNGRMVQGTYFITL